MKKKIYIAVVIILLPLVSFMGWMKYRQNIALQQLPDQAENLIVVKVDQLIQKVAMNALRHPRYYFEGSGSSDTTESTSWKEAFQIPAYLYIYSIQDNPDTWFTTLTIDNQDAAEKWLVQHLKMSLVQDKEGTYGVSSDKHIQLVYGENQLVVAYTRNSLEVKDVLFQMLHKQNSEKDDVWLSKVKNAGSDITAFVNGQTLRVDCEGGSIEIEGQYVFDDDILKESRQASLSGLLDKFISAHWLKSNANEKVVQIKDSLIQYSDGYIALRVADSVLVHDTVVEYTFNDDFEKVETKVPVENMLPGCQVVLTGNVKQMQRVLQSGYAEWMNKYSFHTTFPDEKMMVMANAPISNALNLSNISDNKIIDLEVLLNSWGSAMDIPFLSKATDISRINLTVNKTESGVQYRSVITLKNENINALIQLKNSEVMK